MAKNLKAPEIDEYKGRPTIKFFTGRDYQGKEEVITIGYHKAKAIMDNVEYLYKFVDLCEKDFGYGIRENRGGKT